MKYHLKDMRHHLEMLCQICTCNFVDQLSSFLMSSKKKYLLDFEEHRHTALSGVCVCWNDVPRGMLRT